ncbi:MAG: hypothetical protein PUE98_02850 [Galactobacillus timonensis]|uniref:beta strand repeat-containing protein n=1 Tax=Galactobacillus timonensis TaxID=2041840 RepID=UPI0024093EB2|nr:hypothetical protein [Galactobacillus timonensis]MDD6599391.1 hypothetical protein [Galactobacillus timonensis]
MKRLKGLLLSILLLMNLVSPYTAVYAEDTGSGTTAVETTGTTESTDSGESSPSASDTSSNEVTGTTDGGTDTDTDAADTETTETTDSGTTGTRATDSTGSDQEPAAGDAGNTDGGQTDSADTNATADDAAALNAEPAETEVTAGSRTYTAETASHIQVTAVADAGAFAQDVTMKASDLTSADAMAIAQQVLGAGTVDATGVNITFYDADNAEVEPVKTDAVHVTISFPSNATVDGDEFYLLHQDDSGKVSEVADAKVDDTGAEFAASSFSNYVVGSVSGGHDTTVIGNFDHVQVAVAAWNQNAKTNSWDDTTTIPFTTITSGEALTLENFWNSNTGAQGNLLVFAKAEDGYLITGLGSPNSLGNFYPIQGLNGNFTGYPKIEDYMGFQNLVDRAASEGYQIVFGFSRNTGRTGGISFTIDSEPVGISVSAKSDKEKVLPGDTITVTATIIPSETKNNKIAVSLTDGATYAEINGTKIALSNLQSAGNGTWTGSFTYTVTAEDCANQAVNFTVYSGLLYSFAFSTKLTTSVTKTGSASVSVPIESQTILIQGKDDTVTYDGKEHSLSGFTVNGIEAAYGTNSLNVTLNGTTYQVSGLSNVKNAMAQGTNAGTYTNTVSASEGSIKVYTSQGTDVTAAFHISVAPGTLTIKKRQVILESAGDTKEYDGTALTNDKVTISGDGFVDGEVSGIAATGTITGVGSVDNSISYTTTDHFNKNNYSISMKPGKLTITPNTSTVTLTVNNVERVYDGTALTSTAITSEGLPGEMTVSVTTDGTLTNVGAVDNNVTSYTILDSAGTDVTKYFSDVITVPGELTITKRSVTLTSHGAEKAYDGTALTAPDVTVNGGFVGGEVSDIRATGTITKVGRVTNKITYTTHDGFIAGNYDIETNEGILVVTPNTTVITIQADNASKIYDGTALTSNQYTVSNLPDGFQVKAETAGSITSVGVASNTITGYQIFNTNNNNEDVTDQFSGVVLKNGTLTILKRSVKLTSQSASKVYDGKALTAPDVTVSGDGFAAGEVSNITATGTITTSGSVINTITYTTAKEFNPDNYTIEMEQGTLTVLANRSEIVITAGSATKIYDGKALTESGADVAGLPSGFTISVMTSGSITDVGSVKNTVDSYIIKDSKENEVTTEFTNIKTNDGTLTVTKRPVGLISQSVTREYNGKELTAPTVTIEGYGFVDGEVSEIEATGAATNVTDENGVVNAISYKTAESFNADNYEIYKKEGTLKITKASNTFVIIADSPYKDYDGEPLTATYSVIVPSGFDGYSATAKLTLHGSSVSSDDAQSITDAGSAYVMVTSYKLLDAAKQDVTKNFEDPLLINGELNVYPRLLILTSASDTKEYDGTPLADSTVTVGGDGFAPGERFDIYASGSQSDVGSSSNTIPDLATLTHPAGFKLSNYSVVPIEGTLSVTQNTSPIVVTASSQVKIYDGTPLTSQMHSVSGLPDGFTTEVSLQGSVTNVGDTAEGNHTVSSVKILRDGEDVTSNFSNITTESGTLRVIPASLAMDVAADTIYDGQEQKLIPTVSYGSVLPESSGADAKGQALGNVSFKIRPVSLLNDPAPTAPVPVEGTDYTLSYSVVSGDFVNAGSVIQVTVTAVDGGNYSGTVSEEYKIVPRKLSVVTYSASKDYDGTALTAGGSLSGAVEGDGLRLVMTGSQTSAGSSTNTYAIYGDALPSNYVVGQESLGTLTVFALAPKEAGRTCQDDGYGDGYVWNEAAQACVLESAPPVSSRKLSPQTGVTGSGE